MSVATAPWHKRAVEEVWQAHLKGRKLDKDDLDFMRNVDHRVSLGLGLSVYQEDRLQKINASKTEPYAVRVYA